MSGNFHFTSVFLSVIFISMTATLSYCRSYQMILQYIYSPVDFQTKPGHVWTERNIKLRYYVLFTLSYHFKETVFSNEQF